MTIDGQARLLRSVRLRSEVVLAAREALVDAAREALKGGVSEGAVAEELMKVADVPTVLVADVLDGGT